MNRRVKRLSRMRHHLLLVLWSLLLVAPARPGAMELNEQDVRSAVETWVRFVTADARPEAVIEKMDPHTANGETVAYVAHLSGGGFCLCGADDLVLPVYLYCPEGVYYPGDPNHQYILWEIEERTVFLREASRVGDPSLQQYRQTLSRRERTWQDLTARRVPLRMEPEDAFAEPETMTLDLTTRWHQYPPYNEYCPMGDGGRCVVGCVATATVQAMKYWNWPPVGIGEKSYTWNGDQSCGGNAGGGTLSASFSDPFDWANMPDVCYPWSSPAEKAAVAELNYEVGVALETDYGACGSGAYSEDIDNALLNFNYYDADHDSNWDEDRIVEDIQWLRPVILCARNESAGHCWVAFGYDKGTWPWQFKMNMGWGWSYDTAPYGWYNFDNVPKGLINGRRRITRIAPVMVKFVGADNGGNGDPYNPYEDIEEAVAEAPTGSTLMFRAGSVNTFSSPSLVIDRQLTIRGKDIVIQR